MCLKIRVFNKKYNSIVKAFILSILEDEFNHYGVERPDLDDIEGFYQVGKGNFWLAFYGDELIGTIGLKDYDGIAYLKRMAVKQGYRGKGIAQKLLNTFIKYAKKQDYSEIYLSTSQNLIAANNFYTKEGFKIIESLPDKIPHQVAQIHYRKYLND